MPRGWEAVKPRCLTLANCEARQVGIKLVGYASLPVVDARASLARPLKLSDALTTYHGYNPASLPFAEPDPNEKTLAPLWLLASMCIRRER
jgi:hypothetical protein